MFQRNSTNFAIFSLFSDLLLTSVSLLIALRWRTADWSPFNPIATEQISTWLFVAVPLLWGIIFVLHSIYDPKKTLRAANELLALCLALATAALILSGLFYLTKQTISRGFFLTFITLNVSSLVLWRIVLRTILRYSRWPFARPKTIIVGAGEVGQRLADFISEHTISRVNLLGYVDDFVTSSPDGYPILGSVDEIKQIVEAQQIDDVVVALPLQAYQRVQEISVALRETATQVRIIPDYFNLTLYRARVQEFGGIPLINLREPALNPVQRMTKRLFDIVVTGITLLFVSPIILLVALAIKLDSKGEIFFKQTRIGENGRPFNMYKFRSMVVNAAQMRHQVIKIQEDGSIIHKMENDPRVTRVGKFIRRTSLDELPQLFNVLKGDMSLVGPRPELPWLVEKYEPWQRVRFAVPQGITGWWQVNGRSDKPLHLNTSEDLYYIQNYSIWMDFLILLKTPLVVLRGKGAY